MTSYDVYYMKPSFFRDFVMGDRVPSQADLSNTHTYLTTVNLEDGGGLEEVWVLMQAENWSPNGEACSLIQRKMLSHTSMSVGDVVFDKSNNKWFVVGLIGFKELV